MKVVAAIAAVIGGVVLLVALSWGVWAFGVWTSDIVGRGEATKTKNNSTNRIIAQERFEDMYAEIEASSLRIETLQAAAKDDPSYTNKVSATGAVTYCQGLVGQYNADSRKYTSAEFKAIDLPASIDASTMCTGAN